MIRHVENFRYEGETIPVVTAVMADDGRSPVKAVCGFLGVKRSELRGELRRLREAGVLVAKGGRLQTPVSFYDERSKYGTVKHAAYVFRGREGDASRKYRRLPVIYW